MSTTVVWCIAAFCIGVYVGLLTCALLTANIERKEETKLEGVINEGKRNRETDL